VFQKAFPNQDVTNSVSHPPFHLMLDIPPFLTTCNTPFLAWSIQMTFFILLSTNSKIFRAFWST
jgi:hypothetical protein